ncbi:MAG: M20/M25/M40 family metallo-hydrolase, partial [Planctomycetota bacterium]
MFKKLLPLPWFLLSIATVFAEEGRIHHRMTATLEPAEHRIEVTDEVTLPAGRAEGTLKFLLHGNLEVLSLTPGVAVGPDAGEIRAEDFGIDPKDFSASSAVNRKKYAVVFLNRPEGAVTFTLRYRGRIHHPIRQLAQEYARGFSLTPGLIAEQGVYLGGATWWTPWFNDRLFTFELTTSVPEGWDTVSQGKRTRHEVKGGRRVTRWDSKEPMEEVYLIAAPFSEYTYSAGAVEVMAFLRKPDENLANKYLETTAQYVEMYRKLIGPYPFSKFALVENFWQTGYGMPSFTLLGDKIIRFPFILHSSYPHELLHNYWGNSVYIDVKTGNWCEGITVYHADHLISEQRGQGLQYRRTALQKYTDYVPPETDFPLRRFRSRYDAPSEAIGYGKSMMVWNMLREKVGDEAFVRGFQAFYRDNKFRAASFEDIRKAFEAVTGKEFSRFFEQWVDRKGAPALRLSDSEVTKAGEGYRLTFRLTQVQAGEPYVLGVPVAVSFETSTELTAVAMAEKRQGFEMNFPEKPLQIQIDPQFQLFRKLDPGEVPPSLSKIYGSKKILILLPSGAEGGRLTAYRRLASIWSRDRTKKITVALDRDVKELPEDAAVWLFGDENLHAEAVRSGLTGFDATLDGKTFRLGRSVFEREKNCCIVAVRHPRNASSVAVLLTIADPEAVPGLARKLLHYGKYSALVFEGAEPTNVGKRTWRAVHSPLTVAFVEKGALPDLPHATQLPKRPPLARLAPVFSADRMMAHVNALTHEAMEGRGLGTAGIDRAAEYIAGIFKAAGLRPGGDGGSFFQVWEDMIDKEGKKGLVKNVIGVLPGTKKAFAGQSAILCAHYDHLGRGWPDARKGNEGKLHPGADDNASGIAVLLELAQLLGKSLKPERTVIFVAFTGEENTLAGSRHYVKHMKSYPAAKAMGVLNLDTVGRLGSKKLMV